MSQSKYFCTTCRFDYKTNFALRLHKNKNPDHHVTIETIEKKEIENWD